MALKVTSKGTVNAEATHEKAKRLGRRSKTKGGNYERDVAKKFKAFYGVDLVRTPQSGGFAKKNAKAGDFRGDIVPATDGVNLLIHIECKNTKTWTLPAWLKQAESDCPKGKAPIVVFHQHNSSKDYVCISLEDFMKLAPKENIVTEVEE